MAVLILEINPLRSKPTLQRQQAIQHIRETIPYIARERSRQLKIIIIRQTRKIIRQIPHSNANSLCQLETLILIDHSVLSISKLPSVIIRMLQKKNKISTIIISHIYRANRIKIIVRTEYTSWKRQILVFHNIKTNQAKKKTTTISIKWKLMIKLLNLQ